MGVTEQPDAPNTAAAEPDGSSERSAPASAAAGQEATIALEPDRAEQDRRLAQELSRRGVPPEEVQRLLALGKPAPAASGPGPGAHSTPAPDAPVIEAPPFEVHPTIVLPGPREASAADKEKADRLLLSANIARKRERYVEAESLCIEALALTPSDASALELLGDVLQAVGRVDDALLCYDRSREVAPGRKTAERKFAELRLLQNRELNLLREEYIPRNPFISVMLSLVFPGAGQVYNGHALKGILIALVALALVMLLGWTPYGFEKGQASLRPSTVMLMAAAGAVYVFALVDAQMGATRARKPHSGWDV